ncbi:acyltransferase [Micromonospora sp. NBC_01699]|uniref:acyltransferase family protein n=1 Tax=Micromonospora sp. NBC_01699 TaxID=2975984 RepID=UPI002E297A5F|nr:acyltransferase [Micromonospora sp. NBC_01699]
MRAFWSYWHHLPTLKDRYSAKQNAFGVLRMALACGVIIAHAKPLGFGEPSIGWGFSSEQSDLGTMSLYGFFLVSGFLITESGLRHSFRQYAWARFVRVFPGLWVCLLVTALVFAPLVALYERGSLDGFWSHPDGPFDYLTTNWLASMEQFSISGLLTGTPFGQMMGGPSAFDGSLWTLRYDLAFYGIIAVLIATAVLRRAPRAILLLAAICYVFILRDLLTAPDWTSRPPQHGAVGPFPLIGSFAADWTLYLGFLFVLGAAARLYPHRIPMHGSLAALAAALLLASLTFGAFVAIGPPTIAYLVLYLAVALPQRLARFGRGRDYTYGLYIYGFPVQQIIALLGAAQFGLFGYIVLSLLGTLLFAVPSWHFVEGPAMRLKHRPPVGKTYRRRHGDLVSGRRVPRPTFPGMSPSPLARSTPSRRPPARHSRTAAGRSAGPRRSRQLSYRDLEQLLEERRR